MRKYGQPSEITTTPTKGMPCTIGIGGDSYAAMVVEVINSKRIKIQRTGGRVEVWSLRKDNRWRPQGSGANSGYYLGLGHATDRMDPSF
jgi:hypothetical protein